MSKSGFERLRSVAAMGLMGVGALMGGSARATTKNIPVSTSRNIGTVKSGIVVSSGRSDQLTTTNGAIISAGPALNVRVSLSYSTITTTTTTWTTDAVDSGLTLAVGGNLFVNPDGDVDVSGDMTTGVTVTSDTVADIVSGIDASVQYYFSPDRPVVRALYTLENTTSSPIDTDLLVLGDIVGDDPLATEGGDNTIDNIDKWYVTSSWSGVALTTSRYGDGATVVPTNAITPGVLPSPLATSGTDNYGLRYAVSVPANGTVRVMVFHEVATPTSAAQLATSAADFESLAAAQSAGLIEGLSDTELSQIVNYGVDTDGDGVFNPDDNCPSTANPGQADADSDGTGDACEAPDTDGDGVVDAEDNCPSTANPDQADADGDGTGDVCEAPDADGDGVVDADDNCPSTANPGQADADSDGTGDVCEAPAEGGGDTVTDGGGSGGGGALSLPALLAGLGFELARRRRTHRPE